MATRADDVIGERTGSPATPTEDAGVESPRWIHCRECHPGVLTLEMCGPRFITLCVRLILPSIIVV
jgi:hypothetical protein